MTRFLLFFVLLFSTLVSAQTPSKELSSLLGKIHTMQANFRQVTKGGTQNGRAQKGSGTMAIMRPNKFRWVTDKPSKQVILSDGRTVWIYDAELLQATKESVKKRNGSSPAVLLSGSVKVLNKRYVVHKLKGQGNWFRLTPRSKQDMFRWMELHFNSKDELDRLNLHDNLGQTSWFWFSKIRLNAPLNAAIFRFSPPPGVDVIQN